MVQQIRVSKVITSLVLLGMAIAMIALLTGNTHDFDEKTCSLNRISFSAEAGLAIFIVIKDFTILCCFRQ